MPEKTVEEMSLAELESFVAQKSVDSNVKEGPKETAPAPAEPKPAEAPKPEATKPPEIKPDEPSPGQTKWIDITDDEGEVKLRFRSEDEVAKSLVHSQKLIKKQKETLDRLNAERGELGQYKEGFEESQAKVEELSHKIEELTAAQAQIQAGQSPTGVTPGLQALMAQPGNVDVKFYAELQRLNQQMLAEQAKNEAIRTEMAQYKEGLQQKAQELQIDQGVRSLYQEVDNFSEKHPEYKASKSFAELDDLVSTHGEEVAKAMVSPDDFEKYTRLAELVALQKNDQKGKFDLSRKNFQNLEEALVLQQYRSGALGQSVAEAHKAGIANYEQALNRHAQSASVLPNNLVSRNQDVVMGPNEIETILNMDPKEVTSNPELKKKFNEAIKSLGINTTTLGL
jgi:hypothetical protein